MSTYERSRNSSWSATTETGRFAASNTSILTFAASGRSAPRQRLGRKAEIGVNARSGASRGNMGPLAERLYAVDPAGVATSIFD